MAYYLNNEDENLNPEAMAGGVQTSQAPSVIGAQGASAPGGASSGKPNAPDSPGNFVGIKQYLDANKNQASKLGDQAANVVTQSANQARTDLGSLNTAFNTKAGTAATVDQGALNQLNKGAEKLTAQQKAGLKDNYNAQYKGPQDLKSLEPEYLKSEKSLGTARQNIAGTSSDEGRAGLIGQINDKHRTSGVTSFDNVLLSAGGGREKLAQAANANKDLNSDLLGESNLNAQKKAQDLAAKANQVKQQTRQAVSGAGSALQSNLDKRVADALSKAAGANTRVTEDITDLTLSPETLALFGLSDGQKFYDLSLGNYLTQADINSINKDQMATANEYARYAALSELAGQDPGYLNMANASKAGTAVATPSVNTQKLQSDIAAKKSAMDKLLKETSITGYGSAEDDIWADKINTAVTANLNKYLNSGAGAAEYGDSIIESIGAPMMSGAGYENSRSNAYSDLVRRINHFLEQNHYNRAIKKG